MQLTLLLFPCGRSTSSGLGRALGRHSACTGNLTIRRRADKQNIVWGVPALVEGVNQGFSVNHFPL